MPVKLRQLGWICVAPTPATQACAEAGRSDRRVVAPRNTIRTVATPDSVGDTGASSQATNVRLVTAAIDRRPAPTRPAYLRPNRERYATTNTNTLPAAIAILNGSVVGVLMQPEA